jgi:hypothetical protein
VDDCSFFSGFLSGFLSRVGFADGGAHFVVGFDGLFKFGLLGRGLFDLLFNVPVPLFLGAVADDLAVEMGRVLAHLDFAQDAGHDGGARAAAQFVVPFAEVHHGPDFGAQGGAETAFFGFLVFSAKALALQFPPLGFHLEAGGVVFLAEHFDRGLAEVAEGAELGEGRGVQFGGLAGEEGVAAEGEGGGEQFGWGLAGGQALEFVAVGSELGGLGGDVLAGEPFLEAALPPVGEVLVVDGVSVEGLLEDFADLGEGVEPF